MTSAWWTSRSFIAAATTSSPKVSPQRFAERLVAGDDQAGPLVAGGHQLEEQVGGLGLERDVADLVDDQQRVAAEPDQFGLQSSAVVGLGQDADPVGGGGE